MAKLAVVYHSGYGHTAVIARAVAKGAESVSGTDVSLIPMEEVEGNWQALDEADAIIFGAPTYMGSVSAKFKTFLEAASGRWAVQQWKDKLAAGFTNGGSYSGDKLNTLLQLFTNAMQHSMIWVSQGVMPAQGEGLEGPKSEQVNRMGSFMGLMAQSNNAAAEVVPPSGDIKTGELFGERVARLAMQWVASRRVSVETAA